MTQSLISLLCLQCDGTALEDPTDFTNAFWQKLRFYQLNTHLYRHTNRHVAEIQSNLALNGVFTLPAQLKALRHNLD